MILLRDISIATAIACRLMMILFLFVPRYSKRVTLTVALSVLIPIAIANQMLFMKTGTQTYMSLLPFIYPLPTHIVLFFLAKNRDCRYIFTNCIVDSFVFEVINVTKILEAYIPGEYVFMFVSRCTLLPLMTYLVYHRVRKPYIYIQQRTTRGWLLFTVIAVIFNVTMSLMMSYPVPIEERPECMPALILFFILIPLGYFHILSTLNQEIRIHELREQETLMAVQMNSVKDRIEEYMEADRRFRMERHNYRHKMQTIAGLIEKGRYDELHELAEDYSEGLQNTTVRKYCKNAVMDAVLSSYIHKAEQKGITVITELDFPDTFSVPESELAVVFANAMENAIHACGTLEPPQRKMRIKVRQEPDFMFKISNYYSGSVTLDENGIPTTSREGHGYGVQSIVAFCRNHDAYYHFSAKEKVFSLTVGI
ncbi:MAG: GHKL domain-containing protein [Oscillospiraceae bacterium]|nr:GHKL domain-containing protein [Oscillospiraceae bacterium]